MLDDARQELFTRLWTDAQPAVLGYIHAFVRDPVTARDLVQETALTLLRRFPEYDPSRPFLPWALGVAKWELASHRRDAARAVVVFDAELLDDLTAMWSEVAQGAGDRAVALQTCLDRLARRARTVLDLRYGEHLTSTEIAERLGSNAGAVRVLLQRIRDELRDCIERRLSTPEARS
ncbi:MAG: sigma-70 family RNA polymerase sigma factor [Planctomycetes bacterium]|nr:sigma-70 family RNA polymerase sigma factor [Planctomycetota bacterium]